MGKGEGEEGTFGRVDRGRLVMWKAKGLYLVE